MYRDRFNHPPPVGINRTQTDMTTYTIECANTFTVRVESADMDFTIALDRMKTAPDYVMQYGFNQCLNDGAAGAKAAAIAAIAIRIGGDKAAAKAAADLEWSAMAKHDQTVAVRKHAKLLAQKRFDNLMAGTIKAGRAAKTLMDIVRDALAKAVPGWATLGTDVQESRVAYIIANEGLKPAAQKLRDACVILFEGAPTEAVELF